MTTIGTVGTDERHQCQERVYTGSAFRSSQCTRTKTTAYTVTKPGMVSTVVSFGGIRGIQKRPGEVTETTYYCHQHHPDTKDAKRAKQHKEWEDKQARLANTKAAAEALAKRLGGGDPHYQRGYGNSWSDGYYTGGLVLSREQVVKLLAELGR